jgi:hypothetical protein
MRQDTWAVSLEVDGVDLGLVDTFSGGEIDSEETRYRPGGMAPPVSLGGATTVGNVTVSVLYDLARWHAIVHWLISRVGKGQAVVRRKPTDTDGNVFGRPLTYRGVLKQVNPPEHDSESSDAARIEFEIVPAGTVT